MGRGRIRLWDRRRSRGRIRLWDRRRSRGRRRQRVRCRSRGRRRQRFRCRSRRRRSRNKRKRRRRRRDRVGAKGIGHEKGRYFQRNLKYMTSELPWKGAFSQEGARSAMAAAHGMTAKPRFSANHFELPRAACADTEHARFLLSCAESSRGIACSFRCRAPSAKRQYGCSSSPADPSKQRKRLSRVRAFRGQCFFVQKMM
jgi:hypothetical protein